MVKITLLIISIFVTLLHLFIQISVEGIDNLILFVGEIVLILGLFFILYKQFSSKASKQEDKMNDKINILEINNFEKEKHFLKRLIIFFPLILIVPGVYFCICWFTCADWGPLAALVIFAMSTTVVVILEIGLIIFYSFKYSDKKSSNNAANFQNDEITTIKSNTVDFIDKIILFFILIYFTGYAITFFNSFGYDIFNLMFNVLLIIIPIGYFTSIILLLYKKNIKLSFYVYTTCLVLSFILALLIIINYTVMLGGEGNYNVDLITDIPLLGGFLLSIFGYYRLNGYR